MRDVKWHDCIVNQEMLHLWGKAWEFRGSVSGFVIGKQGGNLWVFSKGDYLQADVFQNTKVRRISLTAAVF